MSYMQQCSYYVFVHEMGMKGMGMGMGIIKWKTMFIERI